MKKLAFLLTPFSRSNHSSKSARFQINGNIKRDSKTLTIEYIISDPFYSIIWPKLSSSPTRMDSLWENTCFELFIAPWGGTEYWEFNFSPSSDWNCYKFSRYRADQKNEMNIYSIKSLLTDDGDKIHKFEVSIPLFAAIKNTTVSLGISAVIKDNTDTRHYYALAHNSDEPDFHNRNSFMLTLTK